MQIRIRGRTGLLFIDIETIGIINWYLIIITERYWCGIRFNLLLILAIKF